MSDEKQSPLSSSPTTMSTHFLQTSSGLTDHRNISSPSSGAFGGIPGTGFPFGDLGLGSHGSPKSSHDDLDSKEDYSKGLAITLPFQDSDHSSANTPSQFSQFSSFKPNVPGDAMLSAINYSENDILQEPLDVNLAGPLPNLNDDILSNMGAPGDLFDGEGNVNDPYMDDYSPSHSNDFGGFSSDGYNIDSDHGGLSADPNKALEGMKQKKPKSQKSPKGHTSPARLSSLQCSTCNKTFTNSSALAKHKLTHSDERKYVCNLCQKAFKRQDHLNGHLMTHREKKPYECSVDNCTKSYCDARSLRRHLENHHNQTPEQIHSAIALVASNAAAVIAAAAATNSAQNKAAQVTQTVSAAPVIPSSVVSNESSQESDIKPLSFSDGSTPSTSPIFNEPSSMFSMDQSQHGSLSSQQDNQIGNPQSPPTVKMHIAEDDSVGQRVQMLLDQANAAQTGTEETITLHGSQGQQTVTISADNLPQSFTLQPNNVLLKPVQPARQWPEQKIKSNSGHSSLNSSSPRSGEPSPSYLQQVSPISPIPNTQVTPPSPVIQTSVSQKMWSNTVSPVEVDKNGEEVKTAECSICQRLFKNVQALNGHMRCHGGYFKKDQKEDKKPKKKEMAPPKSVAPKGNKVIASLPHPSPLDQVGSPQSGQGSAYGSQLQSPVSAQSSEGSDGSAILVQHFGLEQLQQLQIQQQQGELQQQLQQQLQVLTMEQANVEYKINQLKEQIQRQNQQLTQKQEQSMQQELQIQSALQQQITQLQQLQVDSAQNQQRQDIQGILQSINIDPKPLKDGDISILHNLNNPAGTQFLQTLQQNLAAKQEADRQLHDIQVILKQEAENQAQQQRKPQVSKEDMEKHLINRLMLQTSVGIHTTAQPVSFQHIVQAKTSDPSTSQPQHINSIIFDNKPDRQQVFKAIQTPYTGQSPALIHHLPQIKEEVKPEPTSVPSSQVTTRPNIQRQVSFEDVQNQSQTVESPSPQKITQQQLQQLLQQRNDTLNCSQNSFVDPLTRHLDLSPPPMTLNPNSIQSNLQTAIAQIPQFDLKTPTDIGNIGQSYVSGLQMANSKAETTESQDLSLILETIGSSSHLKPSISSAKTLPSYSALQPNQVWTTDINHGQIIHNRKSTINYSHVPVFSEGATGANVTFVDSPGHNTIRTNHPVYKPEARKPETKAAEKNPFAFPGVVGNGAQNDFARPENVNKNPKLHRHKTTLLSQHTELKRRLSIGSELDLNAANTVFTGLVNNKGHTSSAKMASPYNKSSMKPRMRSKSGDDYKYVRSKSEDHTFMRPRSQTEESLWKYKQKSEELWDQQLSKSDGAGLFRNPNCLTNFHLRIKRKHRPAPLFIPGHGSASGGSFHGGFQSRLRSPRILTGEHKGNTPPPYTPPPMLSPIRSGSGLFWTIQRPPMTPMTAPATPRNSLLAMSRGSSISSAQPDMVTDDVPDSEPPPETDILPHVNIGPQYQAEIPPYNSNKKEALKTISKEDLIFDPNKIKDYSDDEAQYYQEFANSAAVQGNGCNTEYALHLLHIADGNIQKAMLLLMEPSRELPSNNTLLSYTYQENEVWTTEESEKYLNALLKCDKDFFSIAKEVGSKTVRHCIQYYYLWKKVCPDEYKRLRVLRNKRERERLYNLRSQQQQQQQQNNIPEQTGMDVDMNEFDDDSGSSTDMEDASNDMDKDDDSSSVNTSAPASVATSPAPMFTCDYPECNASFNSKQALNGHIRVHGGGSKGSSPAREYRQPAPRPKPQGSPAMTDLNGEGFPCKLCGRVFAKVRSRSAHMKSHRMNEADKKPGVKKVVPVFDNFPKMSPNG